MTECGICFEADENKIILDNCGHKFHHKCIKEWTKEHQSCPVCRTDTSPQYIQEIQHLNINGVRSHLSIVDSIREYIDGSISRTSRNPHIVFDQRSLPYRIVGQCPEPQHINNDLDINNI